MDKLKDFLSGKPIWVKIVILICIGALVYFSSGCSLKADKVYLENLDTNLSKGVNHYEKKFIRN